MNTTPSIAVYKPDTYNGLSQLATVPPKTTSMKEVAVGTGRSATAAIYNTPRAVGLAAQGFTQMGISTVNEGVQRGTNALHAGIRLRSVRALRTQLGAGPPARPPGTKRVPFDVRLANEQKAAEERARRSLERLRGQGGNAYGGTNFRR